jgi:hypothetical protein
MRHTSKERELSSVVINIKRASGLDIIIILEDIVGGCETFTL